MIKTKIVSKTSELPPEWDEIAHPDILLSRKYLEGLQCSLPQNIQLYFLLISKEEALLGIALLQLVRVNLKEMLREPTGYRIERVLTNLFSGLLKGHLLVVGNLTHTGQHGIAFKSKQLSSTDFTEHLLKATDGLRKNLIQEKVRVGMMLLKDYGSGEDYSLAENILYKRKIFKVEVQPNMVLKIDENWNSIDDYYTELNKKYKRRYRRAVSKFGKILEIDLDLEEIKDQEKELHSLYYNVSNKAKFNSFILPSNHFFEMKKALKEKFKLKAFILDNKLIGFYSMIQNGKQIETYFLGYDHAHQHTRQLYLNMLYRMLDHAIKNKFEKVVYARTAMEIKSSVGAKPYPMIMYMAHTNKLLNILFKPVFNFINPKIEWEERHPFVQRRQKTT